MVPAEGLNTAWLRALDTTILNGNMVSPRGHETLELPHQTTVINMRQPVLTIPQRRLSYVFMAAEAYWILAGDNQVCNIAPYNKNISKFSDDGIIFFGAYGPRIQAQLPYVVKTLQRDSTSRQAGLTIWRENPPLTNDVPCTIAVWFQVREERLNLHVFMRSSDLWLGLPYDVFNFSMLGHLVSAQLGVQPGALYLTAASSHLYRTNIPAAQECLSAGYQDADEVPLTPPELYQDEDVLMERLKILRARPSGDRFRWWEVAKCP